MTSKVFLSRRNLLTLLSKLDRQKNGELTACTLIKTDNRHPKYAQTMSVIEVTAVDDKDYYTDRLPGDVYPADVPKVEEPDWYEP